jgi:signal transduction histidine kinase/CheY-like chemotaxis protein
MKKTPETIQKLRDRQLSWGLKALAIVGFFTLSVSLSRAFAVGWKPVMTFHVFLYVIILAATLLNRHMSFRSRAAIIIAIPLMIGVVGLLSWGLAGMGLQALFAFCILSTMLFGERTGIVSATLSIAIVGVVGGLVGSGVLTFNFNPGTYLTSYTPWITTLFGMALSVGLIVMGLGSMNNEIEELVCLLQKRNNEKSEIIKSLKTEMAGRQRVEGERRQLEARLQTAKKLEVLGTLAGGVAHDLNNILAGSVTYPDLILSELPEGSPLRKRIEIIKGSGIKAAAIVRDLLTLARRGVKSTTVVNLNPVITDYIEGPEYQKLKSFHPRVDMVLELGENLPNIMGSSIHLHQTIMNLVSNAAEAMHEGGRIAISTTGSHMKRSTGLLGEMEEGDYVVLTITDTGGGIAPGEIEKIFEPFYTKKKMGRSGTGLGMAVVWGAVKDHGGNIDVESTLDKGTVFKLYFPATAKKLVKKKKSVYSGDCMGNGEMVLVVDDVKEQREIARQMLNKLGYHVYTVENGKAAVGFLERASADLLLLDMVMGPDMDGLDTYREAIKLKPEQKAIIISGYTETQRVRNAQRLGAGAYIKKPFLLNDIAVAIRAELDR